jgi:hypothetical protein
MEWGIGIGLNFMGGKYGSCKYMTDILRREIQRHIFLEMYRVRVEALGDGIYDV